MKDGFSDFIRPLQISDNVFWATRVILIRSWPKNLIFLLLFTSITFLSTSKTQTKLTSMPFDKFLRNLGKTVFTPTSRSVVFRKAKSAF